MEFTTPTRRKSTDAKRFERITYLDVLQKGCR